MASVNARHGISRLHEPLVDMRAQEAGLEFSPAELANRGVTVSAMIPPSLYFRPRKPELCQLLRNQSRTRSEVGVADLDRCDYLSGTSDLIRYSGFESSQYGTSDGATQSSTGIPARRGVVAEVLASAGTTDAVVANSDVVEGLRIGI
jgi:hypothetical protein